MQIVRLFIIYPLAILGLAILFALKFNFIGALIASIVVASYLHYFLIKINGVGNPTGYKSNHKFKDLLKRDLACFAISFAVLSVLVFVKISI